MGQVPREVEVTAWLFNPISGFGHKPLLVNLKQVVSRFFVILIAVVGLAKAATAYPPYRTFGGIFDSFDLFAHCFAGVMHLVDCEGGHLLIIADAY